MSYHNKYNNDDVWNRAVLIGLLNLLNDKLYIWNRVDETEYQRIDIPFFYKRSGDERFQQDIFLQDSNNDCVDLKLVDGNYGQTPSGAVRISSISINQSRLTNRYIRGEYTKEKDVSDGELLTYNAPLNLVPIDIGFEVEMRMDSEIDLWKLWENIILTFYKTHVYKVLYKGFVVGVQVGFPESMDAEKPYEFSFDDDQEPKLTFSLEAESWFPIPDLSREFLKSNRIESFGVSSTVMDFRDDKFSGQFIPHTEKFDVTYDEDGKVDTAVNTVDTTPIPPDSNKISEV